MKLSSAHILGLGLLVLFYAIQRYQRKRALQRFGAQHGCQPITLVRYKLPFGLDRKIEILRHKGNFLETLRFEKLGRYLYTSDQWWGLPPILCAEPEAIKTVLATKFKDWAMEENRSSALGPWLGRGIFISSHEGPGNLWSVARGLIRPGFAHESVYQLGAMEPDLQEFVNAIGLNDDGWTASTNLAPIIRRFTLDVTAKTFCGGSIDAQKTGTQPIVEIAGQASAGGATGLENAFDVVNRQAAKRIVVGKLNWVMNSKIFKSACVSFSDFAYERVDRAMAAVKGSRAQEHPQAEVEFVKQMAARSDDRELMRDLLIQMLFAGIDGTTAMISFAMLELSRNAGCWDRIRAELEAEGMLNAGPEGITHTKLKACTYLQNVLNETLRLWPPVPINTRQAVRDTVLPVGGGPDGQSPIVVQKGTVMRYSVWIMHRRKDIFGPDALDWKPDRWVGRRMGWEYIPFNGGPRICLGRKFALTEGCYLLARLAQLYDKIEPLIVEPNITTRVELALIPLKGVPVRLHRAETV